MILTVCPNPCIDSTVYIEGFEPGKLNRINKKIISLSGKGLNIAIAVKRLNYDSYATGFMYAADSAKYRDRLTSERVPHRFVVCDGSVRVNLKIISGPDKLTEINENGTPVGENAKFELIELVRSMSKNADIAVFSGSLPPDLDEDFYHTAGLAVNEHCRIVVDAEGEKLVSALPLKPALIKPNLYELKKATGMSDIVSLKDIAYAADSLIEKGAQCVLVSLGGDGAVIRTSKEAYFARAPKVEVGSTVGAGDSMLAAACVALSMDYCPEAMLKAAVAGGTAAVLGKGTDLISKEHYDNIFPLVETQKLL